MSTNDAQSEFERRLAEDRKRIQEQQAERAREEAAARAERQRKAQEALEMLGAQAKKEEARPERPSLPAVHVVESGDTLSAIALKYYGNAALWTEIYKANKRTIGDDPGKIFPGQKLDIPAL